LTWAKDDSLGHPYFGPHGASYLVKNDYDLVSFKFYFSEKKSVYQVSNFKKVYDQFEKIILAR